MLLINKLILSFFPTSVPRVQCLQRAMDSLEPTPVQGVQPGPPFLLFRDAIWQCWSWTLEPSACCQGSPGYYLLEGAG